MPEAGHVACLVRPDSGQVGEFGPFRYLIPAGLLLTTESTAG